MAHTLTVDIPGEVYSEIQARDLTGLLVRLTQDLAGLLTQDESDYTLKLYLLQKARARFARLPKEILPLLTDSAPSEAMSVQELVEYIQACDLLLELADLSEEEAVTFNRALEEAIAAIDRLTASLRTTIQTLKIKPEAA